MDGRLFQPAGGDAVEVTLREYRRGDLDAMYRLDMECFEPVFRFSRRTMRGFAEAESAVTVVADADGELAGFGIAEVAEGAGYVVTVDVSLAWRRRGLGRTLMEQLESNVKARGGLTMSLHVFAGNAQAIRLYEGGGYVRRGLAEGFYGWGLDALVYEKQLLPG